MNIGAHVSIAGSIANAPVNAKKAGCECFQMFTRPPQGGPAPVLDEKTISLFKSNMKKFRQAAAYIHTPYYINLASGKDRIRHGSISVIRDDLERGSKLGVKALMTHLGSSADLGPEEALKKVIEGVKKIVEGYSGTTKFLMEISAGSGNVIGDTFEEIGAIIKAIPNYPIGICFDSCHAFASGYDLRTRQAVKETLQDFDKYIGLDRLLLVHTNDAKFELGSHKDRHENIGYGKIGLNGFKALINYPALKDADFVLETPPSLKKEVNDIKLLKELRP